MFEQLENLFLYDILGFIMIIVVIIVVVFINITITIIFGLYECLIFVTKIIQ